MTATELLRLVVARLEQAGMSYALGGSVAAMAYGEPRTTLDIDVVVNLDAGSVETLLELFPPGDFYVSGERAKAVAQDGGSFNVIHPSSGMKVDFFAVSDPIEERQIAKRIRKEALPGLEAWFSPPEELVDRFGLREEWRRIR